MYRENALANLLTRMPLTVCSASWLGFLRHQISGASFTCFASMQGYLKKSSLGNKFEAFGYPVVISTNFIVHLAMVFCHLLPGCCCEVGLNAVVIGFAIAEHILYGLSYGLRICRLYDFTTLEHLRHLPDSADIRDNNRNTIPSRIGHHGALIGRPEIRKDEYIRFCIPRVPFLRANPVLEYDGNIGVLQRKRLDALSIFLRSRRICGSDNRQRAVRQDLHGLDCVLHPFAFRQDAEEQDTLPRLPFDLPGIKAIENIARFVRRVLVIYEFCLLGRVRDDGRRFPHTLPLDDPQEFRLQGFFLMKHLHLMQGHNSRNRECKRTNEIQIQRLAVEGSDILEMDEIKMLLVYDVPDALL